MCDCFFLEVRDKGKFLFFDWSRWVGGYVVRFFRVLGSRDGGFFVTYMDIFIFSSKLFGNRSGSMFFLV